MRDGSIIIEQKSGTTRVTSMFMPVKLQLKLQFSSIVVLSLIYLLTCERVDCFGWTAWSSNNNLLQAISDCPTFDGNRTGICVASAAECRNRKYQIACLRMAFRSLRPRSGERIFNNNNNKYQLRWWPEIGLLLLESGGNQWAESAMGWPVQLRAPIRARSWCGRWSLLLE